MSRGKQERSRAEGQLPIAKNEDVEFSSELADANDLQAQERADLADARQEQE
ncbi:MULTISPECIES: YfhD family protein [Paenibacillus]|uniref:YfhD family protein n=1 Tax=Paenibacillus TaxID=44249 RepID=UPI0022B92302|nr:YfhD family protein [Paenibacillus caseinilyticus]MCZ8518698.1 YfhD family protein [Paenibacillus caseinilyticus]